MKYVLSIVMFLLVTTQLRAEENPTPQNFAAGYYLKVRCFGPIYSLELPKDVYLTVKRTDLGDVLAFNGAGEQVPYGERKSIKKISDQK